MNKLKIILFLAVFMLCFLPAGSVLAHATPLNYSPDGSVVLPTEPKNVTITFSERVERRGSSITVFAPNGSLVNNGDGQLDAKDPHILDVELKQAGQGTYTVSWEVISADDGHFTKGAYVFSVGAASTNANAPQQSGFQIQHSSSLPEAATISVELIGTALLLGLLAILAFIWRPMRKKYFAKELEHANADQIFLGRLNWLAILGFVLVLLGGISYIVFKTNELKNLQGITFSKAFYLFIFTVSARWTVYRLVSVIIFFIVLWTKRSYILASDKFTKIEIFLFLLLDFNALSRARVSHAAASNFYPVISVIINFFHLYFKDLWVGGIIAFVFLLVPVIKKIQNNRMALYALGVFSKITAVALAVGGVCGVYVIWLHLKDFNNILTTDWGNKFIILSVFAALLFFSRLFNMFWVEPKLAVANNYSALKFLSFSLPFEAVMGVFILLTTGIMIITTPPISPHYNFSRQAISQGVQITLTQDIYENNKFLVEVQDSKKQADLNLNNLIVSLTNVEKGVGPISAPLEKRFIGGYVFDQNLLSPPGHWKIGIVAQRDSMYDAVTDFTINFPEEINTAKAHAEDRSFGLFEQFMLAIAVILLAVAYGFYWHSKKMLQSVVVYDQQILRRSEQVQMSETFFTKISTNAFTFATWVFPVFLGVIIFVILGRNTPSVLKSSFENACEKNSSVTMFGWHESVPERAGVATSDLAMPGCMIGVGQGQYHFASEKEFLYFTRPAEVQAQIKTDPSFPIAGQPMAFIFNLKDYAGNPVTGLSLDHDRILHIVIVHADFNTFSHIHEEDSGPVTEDMLKNAQFPVHYTFPRAGKYIVAIDFTVRAQPFSEEFYINVGGLPAQTKTNQDFSTTKMFNNDKVTFSTSPQTIRAGQLATLNYHITQNGKPVTDLQPYLSVPMHISVVSEDLVHYVHIHGLLPLSWLDKLSGIGIHAQHFFLPDHFGPDITARISFPVSGIYHIFGEYKHNGIVVPTQFTLKVN